VRHTQHRHAQPAQLDDDGQLARAIRLAEHRRAAFARRVGDRRPVRLQPERVRVALDERTVLPQQQLAAAQERVARQRFDGERVRRVVVDRAAGEQQRGGQRRGATRHRARPRPASRR